MRQKLDNLFRNNDHHLKTFVRNNRIIDRLSKYKIYERIRLAMVRRGPHTNSIYFDQGFALI